MNVLANRQRSVEIAMKISEIIFLVECLISGAFCVTSNSSKILQECSAKEYENFTRTINDTVATKFQHTQRSAFQNSVVRFFSNHTQRGYLFFKCTPKFKPSPCVEYKMENDTTEGLKILVSRHKEYKSSYKGIISINEKDKTLFICNNGSLLPFAEVQQTEVHLREGMFCSALYGDYFVTPLNDCSSMYIKERYDVLETRLRAITFNGVRLEDIKPFQVHESKHSTKRLLLLPGVLAAVVGFAIITKKLAKWINRTSESQ